MLFLLRQRELRYNQVLDALENSPVDLHVCALLSEYEHCSIDQIGERFPEFWTQRPLDAEHGRPWWPRGKAVRIRAIKTAKQMVCKEIHDIEKKNKRLHETHSVFTNRTPDGQTEDRPGATEDARG